MLPHLIHIQTGRKPFVIRHRTQALVLSGKSRKRLNLAKLLQVAIQTPERMAVVFLRLVHLQAQHQRQCVPHCHQMEYRLINARFALLILSLFLYQNRLMAEVKSRKSG